MVHFQVMMVYLSPFFFLKILSSVDQYVLIPIARLIAVFISGVIQGGSLSLHVIILFGMNLDITPISVEVNSLIISVAERLFNL